MKVGLLKARRIVIEVSGLEISLDNEDEDQDVLRYEQTDYLLTLLRNHDIDESDAELVLVLLRDHGEDVLSRLESFLRRFPGLSRNVYHFAKYVTDKEELVVIHEFVSDEAYATEDQLFWMAKLSEEVLSETTKYRDIISALYYHPNATAISRAKVLEIPAQRFGMSEMREEHLRVGKSDWLAWASAVGCRSRLRSEEIIR